MKTLKSALCLLFVLFLQIYSADAGAHDFCDLSSDGKSLLPRYSYYLSIQKHWDYIGYWINELLNRNSGISKTRESSINKLFSNNKAVLNAIIERTNALNSRINPNKTSTAINNLKDSQQVKLFFSNINKNIKLSSDQRILLPRYSFWLSIRNHWLYIGFYLYELLHQNNNFSANQKQRINELFRFSQSLVLQISEILSILEIKIEEISKINENEHNYGHSSSYEDGHWNNDDGGNGQDYNGNQNGKNENNESNDTSVDNNGNNSNDNQATAPSEVPPTEQENSNPDITNSENNAANLGDQTLPTIPTTGLDTVPSLLPSLDQNNPASSIEEGSMNVVMPTPDSSTPIESTTPINPILPSDFVGQIKVEQQVPQTPTMAVIDASRMPSSVVNQQIPGVIVTGPMNGQMNGNLPSDVVLPSASLLVTQPTGNNGQMVGVIPNEGFVQQPQQFGTINANSYVGNQGNGYNINGNDGYNNNSYGYNGSNNGNIDNGYVNSVNLYPNSNGANSGISVNNSGDNSNGYSNNFNNGYGSSGSTQVNVSENGYSNINRNNNNDMSFSNNQSNDLQNGYSSVGIFQENQPNNNGYNNNYNNSSNNYGSNENGNNGANSASNRQNFLPQEFQGGSALQTVVQENRSNENQEEYSNAANVANRGPETTGDISSSSQTPQLPQSSSRNDGDRTESVAENPQMGANTANIASQNPVISPNTPPQRSNNNVVESVNPAPQNINLSDLGRKESSNISADSRPYGYSNNANNEVIRADAVTRSSRDVRTYVSGSGSQQYGGRLLRGYEETRIPDEEYAEEFYPPYPVNYDENGDNLWIIGGTGQKGTRIMIPKKPPKKEFDKKDGEIHAEDF